ncbi:appr-1-p processing enzyme family domain-containing protein [Rodentibacter trehalosifermentans]|uniref:Appr-1-p processing enzyme family domain-containing protein n=1 Tax=Rodentibacter trehalosifermentans TaxID=1908263 RepID=A0A1V3IXN6_9PAST|nr:protein-ADP-ribose hydrolase [Rodentibacter trehalosifermentans]OOF46873.1 appr-1-p processing enzyme family domain-containing protein [Rodentibacter trehalosifermentans]OOF47039.1 appr-1-p processing enzyme family domain-containing protein [Rodentibacter trehalosifermentans]
MNKIPFLIHCLRPDLAIPKGLQEQRQLLRAVMNIHNPQNPIPQAFWAEQDTLLQAETAQKGMINLTALSPIAPQIYLWQGDITRLAVDAIVNAANSQLLGCFHPLHACIDNAIHSAAGLQLRQACFELMEKQGKEEATGKAKITPAFNLPARFVLHTVGPIINKNVSATDRTLLANCYLSCLQLAKENGLKSIAFCCISTGEFRFPNQTAAEIAVQTVLEFLRENKEMHVIFNVFKEVDLKIYQELLG